jgi:hypothetical protein
MLTDEDKKYTLNEFLGHLSHMQDKEFDILLSLKGEDSYGGQLESN